MSADESQSIDARQLMESLQRQGKVILIDVRSKEEYDGGHVAGARNIPLADLNAHVDGFDNGYLYVTVCAKGGGRSADAAKFLSELGFQGKWLIGGTMEWPGLKET